MHMTKLSKSHLTKQAHYVRIASWYTTHCNQKLLFNSVPPKVTVLNLPRREHGNQLVRLML